MDVVTAWTAVPNRGNGNYVAIGNWDGVHLGHQALIGALVAQARAAGGQAVVMGFDPHPLAVLRPGGEPPLLTSQAERAALLADLGVDVHLVLPFDRTFADLTPEAFFEQVLYKGLHPRAIMVGFNFTFGRQGAGTPATLRELGASAGIPVQVFGAVEEGGETVSSSLVRQYLAEGAVERVRVLLGRPFALTGRVVAGDRIGRTLGFPTANLETVPGRQLPGDGVYAVLVRLGDRWHPAMANLGQRPTFAGIQRRLEVHLFDFAGDLYGQELTVAFVARLRGEQRFSGPEALVRQLQSDEVAARAALADPPAGPLPPGALYGSIAKSR